MEETGEVGELYTISNSDLCDIIFSVSSGEEEIEVLKICEDGSFYVKGKKVAEDIKVYEGFVEFLKEAGHYPVT